MRIVLHIDKLILRGMQYTDTRILSSGVQAELSKLLARPGVAEHLTRTGNRSRLHGGRITLSQNVPKPGDKTKLSAKTGRDLGRAIGAGILNGSRK